jgi:small subunit ribosomal protein S16
MLKIRLARRGKKSKAFFRLVVTEHTAPVKGRFIEALGYFNPHTKERVFKEDRIRYWLEKGAQCSDTAHNLLVSAGIVKGPKKVVKIKKKKAAEEKPGKTEEKAEEKKEEKKADGEEPEKTEKIEKESKKPEAIEPTKEEKAAK